MKMPRDLKQQVQAINRRLARLESTPFDSSNPESAMLSKYSAQYRVMQHYYASEPMSQNARVSQGIYKSPASDETQTKVRLKSTDKEWEEMTEFEQAKLKEVVNRIWENPDNSLQPGAVRESYNEAYINFLENHDIDEGQLSKADYAEIWRIADVQRLDANSHFSSDQVIALLATGDIHYMLSTGTFEQALSRAQSNELYRYYQAHPSARRRNYW